MNPAHVAGALRWVRVRCHSVLAVALWGMLWLGMSAPAASDSTYFAQKVQPILQERCYGCHSHGAERIQGGLVLDSASAVQAGGDHGPVVVAGNPANSRLLSAVHPSDPELKLPAQGPPLSSIEIAVLTEWIQQGAAWPTEVSAPAGEVMKPRKLGPITDEERRWWSFRPLGRLIVPADATGWSRQPVDAFILQGLRREGFTPAPPADPRAFVRRITFDLVGLPPTPAEVEAFIGDCASEAARHPEAGPLPFAAVERLADRLLASPQYGERWARHWLDLVRYAESDGYRVDDYRPHSWRYRDWVIDAFNADLSYDRFVQAQLAGDELWPGNPQLARVATSFLRHGIYEYNNRDVRGQWQTILNELTDLTGDVFLGLGLQCARCHDHKFDPLLQRDYFRLQAFFAPLEFRHDLKVASVEEESIQLRRLAEWYQATEELRVELARLEAPYRSKAAAEAISKFPPDIQSLLKETDPGRSPGEEQIARLAYRQIDYEYNRLAGKFTPADKAAIEGVQKRLREYESLKPEPLPTAYTISDIGPLAPPTRLPKATSSTPIEPGFPTILQPEPAEILPVARMPRTTGRRSTLARWITSPGNPLTARVMVNRVWQQHFGRGLVATSSDFGHLGETPSHPELLDYLAQRFIDGNWKLKSLHRLIVTSATYAQGATAGNSLARDPENRWLARFPTRRLEAEQIRDAQLAVTGELRSEVGGPSEPPSQPRRTIYTRVTRNTRDPLLDVFDAPENFASTPQRNVTTTPTQALLLLNGTSLLQRSRAFAKRILRETGPDPLAQARRAYLLAFGRSLRSDEESAVVRFLEAQPGRVPPEKPKDATFIADKMPHHESRAAVLSPQSAQNRFTVQSPRQLPEGDFTLEAHVLLRTVAERESFRTIVAQWDGLTNHPGWAVAVTGAGLAVRPQTLVLRVGEPNAGLAELISSGATLELNKPYYLAVVVKAEEAGDEAITFALKDLSNDCEPMQIIHSRRTSLAPVRGGPQLTLGALGGETARSAWDGLLDDVRLSGSVLRREQWLPQTEAMPASCIGWWRFETTPGAYRDYSPLHNDLQPPRAEEMEVLAPRVQALADLCHVLLNANEFLYTD